jgi:hypothetical protein
MRGQSVREFLLAEYYYKIICRCCMIKVRRILIFSLSFLFLIGDEIACICMYVCMYVYGFRVYYIHLCPKKVGPSPPFF